jgi:hypothetical protein
MRIIAEEASHKSGNSQPAQGSTALPLTRDEAETLRAAIDRIISGTPPPVSQADSESEGDITTHPA